MQLRVEAFKGRGGVEMLRRFRLDGREIEVSDNLDQWHGYDHRYFKVRTADGGVYVLRYDEGRNDWELILFQSAEWQDLAAHPFASHDAKKGIDAA